MGHVLWMTQQITASNRVDGADALTHSLYGALGHLKLFALIPLPPLTHTLPFSG